MRGVTQNRQKKSQDQKFQLTRLMRGVTALFPNVHRYAQISTHTPHARRDELDINEVQKITISTHTPHARRDQFIVICICLLVIISTHTPHARRDIVSFMLF